jgi:hypothetical protein
LKFGDKQSFRLTDGKDRKLSGSNQTGTAEYKFGSYFTAMRPTIILSVCTFFLHQKGGLPVSRPQSVVLLVINDISV